MPATTQPWRGIFVIVVTPFTDGYELDEASLRKQIRFCIEAGAHGLVGPANAEHSRPEGFHERVLTVRTDSTAWATNLRLLAPAILARLNEQLGDGSVVRIVVKGPDAPTWKHGRRSVRDGRGPRDTYG